MSTISTSINSSSTVLLEDYFKRFAKTPISEKRAMRLLYITCLAISVLGILIGVAMINVKSALDAWWKLASVFSGGMLGLFLLAAFARHVGRAGALAGMVAGVLLILWMSLSPLVFTTEATQGWASPFHSYLTIVFGTTTLVVVGFLVSSLLPKNTPNA
jgi:SSS family solute:Na+ symporter